MAYQFEKHTVEHWEVTNVGVDFMPYEVFSRIRKDKPRCEFCHTPFHPKDMTHLAFVKGQTHKLICTPCANQSIEGGAEKTVRKGKVE